MNFNIFRERRELKAQVESLLDALKREQALSRILRDRLDDERRKVVRVVEYDLNLDKREVAPTGDDYNEVLSILGVHK